MLHMRVDCLAIIVDFSDFSDEFQRHFRLAREGQKVFPGCPDKAKAARYAGVTPPFDLVSVNQFDASVKDKLG